MLAEVYKSKCNKSDRGWTARAFCSSYLLSLEVVESCGLVAGRRLSAAFPRGTNNGAEVPLAPEVE